MVDPKGHQASSPWQMPRAAWKDIALRTYKRVWDDNVGLVAAGVAFYGFFALLSLLGLIVLAYGFAAEPMTVIKHMSALTAVLPTDIAFVIGDQLMTAVKASEKNSSSGRPQTSRSRFAMTRQAVGDTSMPIHWRLRFCAATNAVPHPQKASRTISFSLLLAVMILSSRASGFWVG